MDNHHTRYFMWNVNISPYPNVNNGLTDVRAWTSDYIPLIYMDVITYPLSILLGYNRSVSRHA